MTSNLAIEGAAELALSFGAGSAAVFITGPATLALVTGPPMDVSAVEGEDRDYGTFLVPIDDDDFGTFLAPSGDFEGGTF